LAHLHQTNRVSVYIHALQIEEAIHFDAEGDVLCIMHSDGSANVIDQRSLMGLMVEVISAANIVKVLKHYRPFTAVFRGKVQ
jgi:hypothetical protein